VGQRSIYAARPTDTTAIRLTTDSNVVDRWAAWSPDRTLIAFTRENSAGNEDIYIKRLGDSSAPIALNNTVNKANSDQRQPVWSSDGTRLAYVSDEDGDKDIYTVQITLTATSITASNRINLTNENTGEDVTPDWHSQRITHASDRDGNADVYTIKAVFNQQSEVTVNGLDRQRVSATNLVNGQLVKNTQPKWSPDGSKIAYTSNRLDGGDLDIYIATFANNAWGTHTNITSSRNQNDEFIAWDPQYVGSGYRFAFVSDQGGVENTNDVLIMNGELGQNQQIVQTITKPNWNTANFGENNPDW